MIFQEIRYALRDLRKTPGFTVVAILTLALGIGASTTIFTLVDSVVLQPLKYRDSGRLVVVWEVLKFLGPGNTGPNPRHEALWAERATAFSGLTMVNQGTAGVAIGIEHPLLTGTLRGYPNLLDVLQVEPILGRSFRPEDGVAGHDNVVILTYGLWQRLFHSDPNVVGKTIRLADIPREVIGVLPASFRFPKRSVLNAFTSRQAVGGAPEPEILLPLVQNLNEISWNGDYGNLLSLGRLRPGVTILQAEAQLNTIEEQVARIIVGRAYDKRSKQARDAWRVAVQPMQDAVVGESRVAIWLLMAAVLGLLLVACVNLANAQLGRAIAHEHEAAVRSALGASRWQLLCHSIAGSLVIAVLGGALGVEVAGRALAAFARYAPVDLPRMSEIQINSGVLLFSIALTIGSGLLFGILPALQLARSAPQRALQQNDGRSQGNRLGRRSRSWLIGFQVFACTALLLVTGLFAKSLITLIASDKGFQTEHVAVAAVTFPFDTYTDDKRRNFDDAVLEKLRALPGVQSAGLVSALPLDGESWIEGIIRPDRPRKDPPLANLRWVSPGYFETIRERLVAGRLFEERDRDRKYAIISEGTARAAWPGEDPIGEQIAFRNVPYTLIGVVADAKNNSLKLPPANMIYLPYREMMAYTPAVFLARSAQGSEPLMSAMRQAIWTCGPDVTITRLKTLDQQLNDSVAPERFQTMVLTGLGSTALLMAMLGVYGVLSYIVAGRRQEIGLRMALGATRRRIYALTMTELAVPVIVGLAGGWAASIAVGQVVGTLLYGVKATDPGVGLTVTVLFLVAAAAAALIPARRAVSIDPMEALRME